MRETISEAALIGLKEEAAVRMLGRLGIPHKVAYTPGSTGTFKVKGNVLLLTVWRETVTEAKYV